MFTTWHTLQTLGRLPGVGGYCKIINTIQYNKLYLQLVHRSSETSTNQSDVIFRSDDRFWNPVVNSDSIVSKIYMLINFVLWLVFFFFCLHTDKNIAVLSQLVFFWPHTFKHLAVCPSSSILLTLSQYTYLD